MAEEKLEQRLEAIQEEEGPEGVLRFCDEKLDELPKTAAKPRVWLKLQRLSALISLKKFEISDNDFENLTRNIESLDLSIREQSLWKGRLFNIWGISLGSRGFFARAVEKYQLSHDQIVSVNPQQTATLSNIGLNLMYLGKWNAAHQVFLDGLRNTSADDLLGRAVLLTNHGELLRRWDKKDAQQNLEEAVALNEKLGDNEGLAEAAHSLIRLFLDHSQPEKAESLIDRIRAIKPSPLEQYCQLFQLRIEGLWASANSQPERAIGYYSSALDLALEGLQEHALGIQYDLALIFLQEAVQGSSIALERLRILLSQIVNFAEQNNLLFILVETLMIQTKVVIYLQEYIPGFELLVRINMLLEQLPMDHLKSRVSDLERELTALNPQSIVQQEAQMNVRDLQAYLEKYSKLA
ncbi:MAG: hypothetical protein ACE5OZ_06400 [Candidatus Heimdallarchaeota archaeon]